MAAKTKSVKEIRADVRAEIRRLRREIAELETLLDVLAPERKPPPRKRRHRTATESQGQSLLEKIGADR